MTDLRDKIAAIIDQNLPQDYDGGVEAADAIIAALPDMVAPLVWEFDNGGDTYSGLYEIYNGAKNEWHCVHSASSPSRIASGVSRDRAIAAANAHNAAAVVAAITGGKT